MFFNRIRRHLINLIRKETRGRSIRAQTSVWIRFRGDEELVNLVFNSLMTNVYNLNNLDQIVLGFPVSFKDISKFEFRNQISINLLATEGKEIYICRKGGNYERAINVMIISESNRKHYIAIKSLCRLLSSKNTNHKGKECFCMNCLQGFKEVNSRDEHIVYCMNNESLKVEMSRKNPIVQYSDGQFQFKVPFIMYYLYLQCTTMCIFIMFHL